MTAEIKIARKILRSGGVIFPLLYFLFSRQITLTVTFAIGLFFIVLEILRFRLPVLNRRKDYRRQSWLFCNLPNYRFFSDEYPGDIFSAYYHRQPGSNIY